MNTLPKFALTITKKKMKILQSFPIIKLLGAFLSGIICWHISFNQALPAFFFVAALFFLVLIAHIFYTRIFKNFERQWIFGLLLLGLFLTLGMQSAKIENSTPGENHFGKYANSNSAIVARVLEAPQEKANTFKLLLNPYCVWNNEEKHQTEGLCLAYIQKDSLSEKIKYGDIIVLRSEIQEVAPPGNPHQFNYKKYLETKHIFHQVYIPSEAWMALGKGETNWLFDMSYGLRNYFIEIFQQNGMSGDEFAVATALVLGYDDNLSYELSAKFSHAGAMHVLCVSGLHVGIIFLIISSLLKPLKRFRYGKFLNLLLVVLVIWFFAMITGLSSSVMRAATMFSFVALGNILKRKNNIYNTLALSAFLLLILNPNLIFALGFQLSYTAVIGIVAIQPHLYSYWKSKYWILDKAWAIVTVSIAAQIATLPISLLHFHQFPNYFILSNLIVIPAATAIVYLGVLVLVVSPVKILSVFFAKILSGTVFFLNKSVELIDSLPFSFAEGIVISNLQALLLFASIFTVYWCFRMKSKNLLFSVCPILRNLIPIILCEGSFLIIRA